VTNETIVINTGPLILLDKIEALDLFGKLPARFVCPSAVRQELDAGLHRSRTAIVPDWLSVESLKYPLSTFVDLSIDLGEAEVIQLALERNVSWVCLDDLRGRKVAKRQGLNVIGLLGLLAWAKELRIIPHLRPYAERLVTEGGRYSPKLLSGMLATVGE
jgi:predicted nucleic acid-binding protein